VQDNAENGFFALSFFALFALNFVGARKGSPVFNEKLTVTPAILYSSFHFIKIRSLTSKSSALTDSKLSFPRNFSILKEENTCLV